MTGTFIGNFDLASLSLWLFWIFFAGLIFYIQRENMREGYEFENDDGSKSSFQSPFPMPEPKTFKLPHGRGEVTVPNSNGENREIALRQTNAANGYPLEPTGDPMTSGVGPGAWAARRDLPELDSKGHPKIVPLSAVDSFYVGAGRDPRGLPVMAGDGEVVGKIVDIWFDEPEQLARYYEYELHPEFGEGRRLVPVPLARTRKDRVAIKTIFSQHFNAVPQTKAKTQITMLEEEKISAYYAGGILYASDKRFGPLI